MSALYVLSAVFFAFPLLAPAVGIVLYPFLLQGAVWAARLRIPLSTVVPLTFIAGAVLLLVLADPVGLLRIIAFLFGITFVAVLVRSPARLQLLLKLAAVHAVIVLLQLIVVMAGVPLDFSEVLRSAYGSLLPPTGLHIDYNAFSQWDVFIPRVAGLNREPAFASLLFLGFLIIAFKLKERRLALLFLVAVVCTMSKVVFPLAAAIVISLQGSQQRQHSRAVRLLRNLAVFVGVHLLVIIAVRMNLELVEIAMALDASFYHRFVGLHTLASQWDQIAWFGNSINRVSSDAIFADYEFLDDRRAFLDGSAVSKLAVDFGRVGIIVYAVAAASVCRNAFAAAGLALGGLFINLLSVSPATLLSFWLLSGMHTTLPLVSTYAQYKVWRSANRRARPTRAPTVSVSS